MRAADKAGNAIEMVFYSNNGKLLTLRRPLATHLTSSEPFKRRENGGDSRLGCDFLSSGSKIPAFLPRISRGDH